MDYAQRLLAAAELVLETDRRVPSSSLSPGELGVNGLKPHQLEGVAWLLRRYELGVNVILGDEMGLGKTLQAISLLSYLKINSMCPGPFLIICPLSVTDGWASEFSNFCPTLRIIQYIGDKSHRLSLRRTIYVEVQTEQLLPFDVLLTTYDVVLMDQNFLSQVPWCYAVIDEAQRLKNPSSVLYVTLRKNFVIPRCLLLTGTPIQNNLSELWALLHFCMPRVFGSIEDFLSLFKEAVFSVTAAGQEAETKRQFTLLKHVLKAFMLRRTKAMLVDKGLLALPPLTELTVMVPLVPLQKKLYVLVLRRELQTLLSFAGGSSRHQSLQNIVMQLRKACSHPYLFNGIEPEPYEEGEHVVLASGKLIFLDMLLKELHKSGHRVLLFAQMTHTLDILQDFLELRNYSYERLDGSVRAEERFAAIRNFGLQDKKGNSETKEGQSGAFVFMISTRAGGVGLNLVAADTDWNPQADKQALQRAHRIGQLNHVLSVHLVTERSIEEVILRRAERKLKLSHNIIGQEDILDSKKKDLGIEAGDMRSLILGLHIFDPTDSAADSLDEEAMNKLESMANRVIMMHSRNQLEKDGHAFEINPTVMRDNGDPVDRSAFDSININPGLDEATYKSWVEKLKDSKDDVSSELEKRRVASKERSLNHEAEKLKAKQKKQAKWESLGYVSLTVELPDVTPDCDVMLDSASVEFVFGDCTNPSKTPAIIFSCIDNSGSWGHGGMFDALAKLSGSIPEAYERAHECGDLDLGDLHLIELDASATHGSTSTGRAPLWVALAVVQSHNARRKVPRSKISLPDLDACLSKAAFSAAKLSASLHMPRIGYQDSSQRSDWYPIERLLWKYASLHGITIYVYYYRRPSIGQQASVDEE